MERPPSSPGVRQLTRSREVAVLGGGSSGRAAARLLESGGWIVRMFDEKGGERGGTAFDPRPNQFAFGVVSPGFAVSHPWRARAEEAGLRLVGESAFAASFWKGPVLCVTGTNGKTTLTRFLEEALRRNGESAFSCGNIGRPFSDLCLEAAGGNDRAVCEASSFQLHDWPRLKCEAGFWTNFDFDHLDWHGNLGHYFAAKWKLVESGAPVFAGPTVPRWAIDFGYPIPENLIVADEPVSPDPAEIGVFSGRPWNELFRLARRWWLMTGREERVLLRAARDFTVSPHRLEKIGTVNGVTFVNDSKATNPHAALAAVDAVDLPIHWLGGGSWKGEDLFSFAGRLAGKIASADTFGSTGEELAEILQREGCRARYHPRLAEAFAAAVAQAGPGSTVLLSPGFASFDQFGGYAERGQAFRERVEAWRLSAD